MLSLPSSSSARHRYHVFLSFRGEDTRKNFTDHLYAALRRKGIVTFRDDSNLRPGEEIAPELFKAIKESWCSLIVFSETYAFSGWCLEELAEIVKQRKERGHKVFPIFYDVDPTFLRNQTGKVEEAFAKHEERYKENKEKTQKWRSALTEVSNVKGWHLNDRHETEFIDDIVEKIYSLVPHELIGPIIPSKDFMPSKSSNLTFNQILEALQTTGVNMIGLYGMPGVGKTTLAKQVLKHAKEQKLFDHVVMVTMSQTPDINKIQDRIGESLRLELKALTEEGKAEELLRRLKELEKILIIIDDVWNEFDFHTIGIPMGDEHKGCKILLTMRLQQVCVRMNCQEKFLLNILSEDEAWALFRDKADLKDNVSITLNEVANEVASECKGLPLAIVAVGTALKGESLDGWIAANKRFKDSRHLDNEDVCEVIYNRLQLSYDYLKGDNIRACFLLCSLFPEDVNISIEKMLTFVAGLGLFSGIHLMEDLRREIRLALRRLEDSGLLLKSEYGYDDDYEEYYGDYEEYDDIEEYGRMHDMVRDFAHWLTLKEKNVYMVKEGLMEWPISERFECCTAMAFWNSNINNFPEKLNFSKVKILVFTGKELMRIPSTFVKGMKALQVLLLRNVIFSLKELKFMTNLRTLRFEDCKLENISSLRNLEDLEILVLCRTNIYELPKEFVASPRLKLLYFSLSRDHKQVNFPPNLLARLTSLQELHMTCGNNVNLSELNSLSGLTVLSLRVSTDQCFPENSVFPKLPIYSIAVNDSPRYAYKELNFTTLKITNSSSSLSACKELFCNVEKLSLRDVRQPKNIVPSIDQKGLNELTSLELNHCTDMECLMNTTEKKWPTTAFSNLEKLHMKGMSCFKQPCHGPVPIGFLQKLKDVCIESCERLKVVFQVEGLLEKGKNISETPLLSNLTSLYLDSLPELKSIWELQSITHQNHGSLQSLEDVRIQKCSQMKCVFPTFVAKCLSHLEQLIVYFCDELEQVFDFPQDVEELKVPLPSFFKNLELEPLPQLNWIWKGPRYQGSRQNLKVAEISNCNSLKYLFSQSLAQSLVVLEKLQIESCDGLEHITTDQVECDNNIEPEIGHLHPPLFPKLTSLAILCCPRLKYVFHVTKEKNGVDRAIVLPCLQDLLLENLLSLTCFCSENYPILSPSLENFIASECPRLEFFTIQQEVNKQVEQKELRVSELGYDNVCDTNNSQKIPQIQAGLLSRIEGITLMNIHQLQGPIQVAKLHYLRRLIVSKCAGLKSLFSSMLAQNLPQLNFLSIECCPKLEEIIKMDDQTSIASSSQGHLQPISFPSLAAIHISDCNNLKSLLPISVTRSLPKLWSLQIAGASKLEQVFGCQGELKVEDNQKEIMFPKLQKLKLSELRSLKSFAPMGYRFLFPSLNYFEVTICPKLPPSFIMDSNFPAHARTKVVDILRAYHCVKLSVYGVINQFVNFLPFITVK
ncbi:hypothetical protein PTKIN_Ptkin14bG0052900 [Pterospermum kingtungense]